MRNIILKSKQFVILALLATSCNTEVQRETISFDEDWSFCRYGLQADGSRLPEPGNSYCFQVKASSEDITHATDPLHLMDSDTTSYWQANKNDEQPQININLQVLHYVNSFKINSSDDASIVVKGSADGNVWESLPGNFKYIRIESVASTSPKPLRIYEFYLFDKNDLPILNTLTSESAPHEPQFDDKMWRKLDLPHDWAIEEPFRNDLDGYTGKLPWRGIGWYRKQFKVSKQDRDKLVFVDFDGAMANAEVYLNGNKIGHRPYGYSSFRLDLTPHIKYDEQNVIAVRLNTEEMGSRWYPGAGIYRHVRLEKVNKIHIPLSGVFVTTPSISNEKATIAIELEIENRSNVEKISYKVDIAELDEYDIISKDILASMKEDISIKANSTVKQYIELEIKNPNLWDLEHRNRYNAQVTIYKDAKIIDRYNTPFGFRTLEFTRNNGFLLNGQRVQLQGVCMHHDLGALGAAINTSALERQIRILKSFGANAIRTAHNIPAPELLELADKMGMLIVNEIFDGWASAKNTNDYAKHYQQWHQQDIKDWVKRDRNHPSVIMWSLGNEVREQYYPELQVPNYLRSIVKKYDITRPVSFGASYPSKSALNGTELQVDVHGMNYPSGVYGGPDFYKTFLEYDGHENLSGYASETSSTLSSRGVYFPEEKDFQVTSYDLHEPGWASLADEEFAALDKYPAICGEFVWTGFDYLGEPTPFNSDMSVLLNHANYTAVELAIAEAELGRIEKKRPTSRSSYFGIVDLAGFPKDRFYLYQAHWMPNKPMAHILPHWNFPDRVGKTTPVFVYSSGDEAELFVNGISQGRKKKQQYEYRFRWEDVVYQPGEVKVITYKNGKEWAANSIKTTDVASSLKLSAEKDIIDSSNNELAFLTVSICDKEGFVVPTANNEIMCELEGDGEIVATDNGDATSLIPFGSNKRNAFNGLMLVIIKANKKAEGNLRVIVKSPGLEDAQIILKVE